MDAIPTKHTPVAHHARARMAATTATGFRWSKYRAVVVQKSGDRAPGRLVGGVGWSIPESVGVIAARVAGDSLKAKASLLFSR